MRIALALIIALATFFAAPLSAQVLSVETYVEEWDNARQQWVRVEDGAHRLASGLDAAPAALAGKPVAMFGPFRVIDQDHAEMVGVTGRNSPADFAEMLRAYPGIKTLALVEAPGTDDDRANMQVGRMIRAAGITTHVPRGGSVRSGAVELFLAGAEWRIDDGAEFAVHSWIDAHGRQPRDFAMDAGPNRMYLDYYREMGMKPAEARAFYAMTNSVGFGDAKWLTAQDMRGWLGLSADAAIQAAPAELPIAAALASAKIDVAPMIAYLDLDALLP
ncbi:MAG: alpha/beta hydrolase [Pontixanthobacter sp.]